MDPRLGTTIGTYRLVERMNEGAFGVIYRAEHVRLSKKSFAIKILHPHVVGAGNAVARFRREAEVLSTLEHPNVVQVVDFDRLPDQTFYLVMEWIGGVTLEQILRQEGRLPPKDVLPLMAQLLDALLLAHRQGIVHRDLKPENLMIVPWTPGQGRMGLGGRGLLKILDFGLARISEGIQRLTATGAVMGTIVYMAPEQLDPEFAPIGPYTDLYTVGLILTELLTGQRIFAGNPSMILRRLEEPPPPLASLHPDLQLLQSIEPVYQKLLSIYPEDRYQSAQELLEALIQSFPSHLSATTLSSLSAGSLSSVLPTKTPSPALASPDSSDPTTPTIHLDPEQSPSSEPTAPRQSATPTPTQLTPPPHLPPPAEEALSSPSPAPSGYVEDTVSSSALDHDLIQQARAYKLSSGSQPVVAEVQEAPLPLLDGEDRTSLDRAPLGSLVEGSEEPTRLQLATAPSAPSPPVETRDLPHYAEEKTSPLGMRPKGEAEEPLHEQRTALLVASPSSKKRLFLWLGLGLLVVGLSFGLALALLP